MPGNVSRTVSPHHLNTINDAYGEYMTPYLEPVSKPRVEKTARHATRGRPSVAKSVWHNVTRALAVQAAALPLSNALSIANRHGRHLLAEAPPFCKFRQGAGGTSAPTKNVLQPAESSFDPLKPAPGVPLLAGTAFGALPSGFKVLPPKGFDYTQIIQGRLNNCWLLASMIATVQSGSLLTPTPIAATSDAGVYTATFNRRKVDASGTPVVGKESIRVTDELPFRGKIWDIDNNAWSGSPGYRLAWPGVWVKAFVAFNNRYPMPQVQTPAVRGFQILDTEQGVKTALFMLTGKQPLQLDNDGTKDVSVFKAIANDAGSAKTALSFSCEDVIGFTGPTLKKNLDKSPVPLKVMVFHNPLVAGDGYNALVYGGGVLPAGSAVSVTCSHYYVLLGVNEAGWFRFHNPVGKNKVWGNLKAGGGQPDAAAYNPVVELPFDIVKYAFKQIFYT